MAAYGPYVAVPSTGGLETANGSFDGYKTNISFVFGENGLRHLAVLGAPPINSAVDAVRATAVAAARRRN